MKVRIFKPTKSTMQSGRAKTKKWHLEYETKSARTPEPLMGWVASKDTRNQVVLKFDCKDSAIAYAEKKGWEYKVLEAQEKTVKPRNYSDNFVFDTDLVSKS